MRKLLRKIILWALKSEPVEHDAAGMDKEARDLR
jgi:hypothetical protein